MNTFDFLNNVNGFENSLFLNLLCFFKLVTLAIYTFGPLK